MGGVPSPVHVVVCVPTYRRPEKLAALLQGLARQTAAFPFAILVGNNDARDLATYPVLSGPGIPAHDILTVDTPGVSAVRNRLVARALERYPDTPFLAFLDDDQVPEPDWLAELVAAGERHRADIAGGPVEMSASVETVWARAAVDKSYLPKAEGVVPMLNECGNLLLATAFLRRLGREPFDMEFARTGGEDYEFFLHAIGRGARLVWAPRAIVREEIPPSRLTLRGLAWRSFSTAASQSRADRAHHGLAPVLVKIAREAAGTPVVTGRALARDRDWRFAAGLALHRLSCSAGRIIGLFGARAERYGTSDAPAAGRQTP
ncbi:glycosyltransferase family 2 protein [Chthonobacter rhizosphaerae]|uniref:glycosyltransferase family 2 protein n=1 Tax=Chthonobacter rhizosphaerae TaxID=2735553 RepID=UPI0015EF013C|nr:glycosyltransferase [Chthonobacter rhizosphaerae]